MSSSETSTLTSPLLPSQPVPSPTLSQPNPSNPSPPLPLSPPKIPILSPKNPLIPPLLFQLAVGQFAERIPDYHNPQQLEIIRGVFVGVHLIVLGVYWWTREEIKRRNDTSTVIYTPSRKIWDRKSLFTQKEPLPPKTTTARDYDLDLNTSAINIHFWGFLFFAVLHLEFGFMQPLVTQSIVKLKGLFDEQVIQIHVLGKPEKGMLERPFKPSGLLVDALSQYNQCQEWRRERFPSKAKTEDAAKETEKENKEKTE